MGKRFRALVVAGALTAGLGIAVLPHVLSAQTTNPVTTTGADRDSDYGWIGLFGLAGLAGLMRRSPTDHTITRPSTATR
jgi:MYXO-CTERM domain-containing protein